MCQGCAAGLLSSQSPWQCLPRLRQRTPRSSPMATSRRQLHGLATQNTGSGWFAYSGTAPNKRPSIAAPPQGSFAAVTDQSSQGTRILYQDVALEPGQTHTLSLYVYYNSTTDRPPRYGQPRLLRRAESAIPST